MIINHTKKFVYLRVPKTGSTSIESQLIDEYNDIDDIEHTQIRFCGITEENNTKWKYSGLEDAFVRMKNPHLTLTEFTQKVDFDFSDYDIYGVLRNPVDRFISSAYHSAYFQPGDNRFTNREPDKNLNDNIVVEKLLNVINQTSWYTDVNHMLMKQVNWLYYKGKLINNLFLYEDVSKMMEKITGNPVLKYNYRNKARPNKNYDDLDIDLKNQIIELYKDDVLLYDSLNT